MLETIEREIHPALAEITPRAGDIGPDLEFHSGASAVGWRPRSRWRSANNLRQMADWVTISQVATAGGTLVLAIATFSSIKSANRSARIAERSMLVAQRPVLIPSRSDDLDERVRFGDGHVITLQGHGGILELVDERLYMAIALRNGGAGLAVIHGWHIGDVAERQAAASAPPLDAFRRQLRDLYIPRSRRGSGRRRSATPTTPTSSARGRPPRPASG